MKKLIALLLIISSCTAVCTIQEKSQKKPKQQTQKKGVTKNKPNIYTRKNAFNQELIKQFKTQIRLYSPTSK